MNRAPILLVDARNLAHAADLSLRRCLDLCASFAASNGVSVMFVVDGGAEDLPDSPQCDVVASGDETADTVIERAAQRFASRGRRYWIVSSDRAIRDTAGGRAERSWDSAGFARELARRSLPHSPPSLPRSHLERHLTRQQREALERMRRPEDAE